MTYADNSNRLEEREHAVTWRSLDESKSLLQCSSDGFDLAVVVAIQVYALTNIDVVSV